MILIAKLLFVVSSNDQPLIINVGAEVRRRIHPVYLKINKGKIQGARL